MDGRRSKSKATSRKSEEGVVDNAKLFYLLRLFVTGLTPRSLGAIENVRNLCEQHLKGRHRLEVIDIYQQPKAASEDRIVAVPTLVRKLPLPSRQYVGDMTNKAKILAGLDIRIDEKPTR